MSVSPPPSPLFPPPSALPSAYRKVCLWSLSLKCPEGPQVQVGAEAEDDRIDLSLSQVEGKDITELIAASREKLASVPAGGGGGAIAVFAAPAAGVGAAAPTAEAEREEKVEEKEKYDDDMGFSLFD